ncbi:hypothetical protein HY837_04545 [archaeon]|nr:hypothetical protein [archaeon]
MICQKCKQERELFTGKLCSSCFINVLEKRIKKSIREQGGLERNEKILFLLDESVESKITKFFFEKIYSNLPLKIDYEKKGSENPEFSGLFDYQKGEYDKIIVPFTSEKVINDFLKSLFENESFEREKRINFLESLTIEEIKDVAKIKNFEGITNTHELLDKIEEKYPGSKHSLLKSIKILES